MTFAIPFVIILLQLNVWCQARDNVITQDDQTFDISTRIPWMTVTKHECSDNNVYDNALHKCRPSCRSHEIYYNVTHRCENKEAALAHSERLASGGSNRPLCKNITVHELEYEIDEEGVLRISFINVTFLPGHFTIKGKKAHLCFPFTANFIRCGRWVLSNNEYQLRQHGLVLWSPDHHRNYEPGEFYFRNTNNEAVTCRLSESESISEAAKLFPIADLYASAWTVSAVSMLVAFVIYFVSQKLRKSHTKVLLGHMASLFLFYVTLILRAWGPVPSVGLCLAYGILIHYSFLAAFFWLNVLAFDIWKRLPSFHSHDMASSSRHRFLYLSLYAWGCPLLMSVAAILADQLLTDPRFQPAFAANCWFATVEAKALFMYGPAALIMATNVFFFVMTVAKLRSFSKDVAIVNKKIHNQMMKMYVKLLVVMGLCWIMEVISALFSKHNSLPYWYFTDFINGLQGFFLFIVYVCKASVMRDLITAWERRKCPACCVRIQEGVYFTRSSMNSNSQREHCSSTSIIHSSEYGLNGSILTGLSAATLNTNYTAT